MILRTSSSLLSSFVFDKRVGNTDIHIIMYYLNVGFIKATVNFFYFLVFDLRVFLWYIVRIWFWDEHFHVRGTLNREVLFVPNTAKPRRWRSGLERSPRKRKIGCSNPSSDKPKSFKQVVTAPLPNDKIRWECHV